MLGKSACKKPGQDACDQQSYCPIQFYPGKGRTALLLRTMGIPSAAAALAVASSPSGCASFCIAMGAISTGYAISRPAGQPYMASANRC